MVTRITEAAIRIFFESPLSDIYVTPVVMKMLYFDPRELRPLLELLFRGFFDEEADEPSFFKELDGVFIEVVGSVTPDDPIHTGLFNSTSESVKQSTIRCKEDSVLSVFSLNVSNRFNNLRVEEGLTE